MTIPANRVIAPTDERRFERYGDAAPVPPLTDIQTRSYARFLQLDVLPDRRTPTGLEGVLQEIFPIESYDKRLSLDYSRYELGKPRYDPDECRQLRLTYGRPFRVWLRLRKADGTAQEEEVYLGDMPIMIGGGEFIINGAERVVVSQLHRSPGVDFVVEREGDKDLHSCRVIPERGSWIEINCTKKDTLGVRIDQSGKFSALTLLRAMDPQYGSTASLLREFYPSVETLKLGKDPTAARAKLVGDPDNNVPGCVAVDDVIDPETGEVYLDAGKVFTNPIVDKVVAAHIKELEVLPYPADPIILLSLADDGTESHEAALLKIYQRLRPGNPPQLEKARELFKEKFNDQNRYRLGRVGRFRINRKFDQNVPETEMTLRAVDFVNAIKYLLDLRGAKAGVVVDDIDHLGNRRLRTIDELAADELRKGFLKLRRTVQERMAIKDAEEMSPRTLINPKSVSAAIEYFFGRSELSQVVDQTNPLSQLTHERRLSALGPGGLNRKRAGFEVRDVHISHYGRICPIETPEGTNIGLISSLSIFAEIDEYGFLTTPYRKLNKGKLTDDKPVPLRADEESTLRLAPADTEVEKDKIKAERVNGRASGELTGIASQEIDYLDVSPKQMVGVSAGLIPFLEHDDANRALMGSNMQRQAVPLLVTEPPIVATGLEKEVARHSGMLVKAQEDGVVVYADSERIKIEEKDKIVREYVMRKFHGLNERTCLNQKPIIQLGQKVKKNQIIADGAATHQGELALGRNVLVAFMSWEGYNFEDAIIINERLVKNDTYTSIHIEEFDIEIRETKLGKEEFTRDIPNVSPKALNNLDENGIVRIGTFVKPGDILVGKVSPKSRSELTPEEKLLHAIFGRAGEDVKNDSLEVPSGVEGIVIQTHKFSRRASMTEEERKELIKEERRIEGDYAEKIATQFREFIDALSEVIEKKELKGKDKTVYGSDRDDKVVAEQARAFKMDDLDIRTPDKLKAAQKIYARHWERIQFFIDEQERKLNSLKRGDELPTGVQQMVKVYVATKRVISVGDKMAGRHGNKGVISKVLPEEDMPYLKDGTPVDIILNPLGVPSRMNVGQILETHLGYAASKLNFKAVTPVFDGAVEAEIKAVFKEAGIDDSGKSILYDGRTGDRFEQPVTVGYMYMLKLHHLVDDKVHARATGPYSLITQQPLGGKARFGGQRFGEMEVWALEAYGAAYILQELLTVKSDDVEGRTKIYESMVKGENTLEAGTPASFDVLTHEIRGLGLNM
ncbi:MAG: DNA-directed RNA polymerase subunit beta, partial [Fimbriiglobus sp.]|nr:DNA-directed RNA polymerase subunit beta [Fimbriiglobus sp.]